jgi:uncharacterized protein YcbK (DUF882 family)
VASDPVNFVDPDGLKVLNLSNYPVSPNVTEALTKFNDYIGQDKNIVITGGDRGLSSQLGAKNNSQHSKGTAADIVVPGQSHLETANQALDSKIWSGVGWYQEGYRGPNGEGPHVHVDLRDSRSSENPANWGYDKYGKKQRIPKYEPCKK